jgi:hypothetical protein
MGNGSDGRVELQVLQTDIDRDVLERAQRQRSHWRSAILPMTGSTKNA